MKVKRLTEKDLFGLCDEWTALHRSGSNQTLFTSWQWMSAWWATFKQEKFELLLLGVFDGDNLVGIAPLYTQDVSFRGLPIKRTQFIGSNSSGAAGFRAEYLQFVCSDDNEHKVCCELASCLLRQSQVGDFLLNDVLVGSATEAALLEVSAQQKCYIRETSLDRTYYVNTDQLFTTYLSALGANTRRRVFNGRSRLESSYALEVQSLDWQDLRRTLSEIEAFYKDRWSAQLNFSDLSAFLNNLEPHKGALNGVTLDGSRIVLNAEVKALSLNIGFNAGQNDSRYNFMLGFDTSFNDKVSLGMLTLGYDLERSCGQDSIARFDLMAGTGKQTNYKERMATEGPSLRSIQIVRKPWLKWVFAVYDRFFQS